MTSAEPSAGSTPLDLLVLPGSDFSALADSLTEFRGEFEQIARPGRGGRGARRLRAGLSGPDERRARRQR